jgi:L-alanine-DL-glutamate epimerase-like enolase superfamily enzyme/pimeloyl-ACP methyl ester carboxylesterase
VGDRSLNPGLHGPPNIEYTCLGPWTKVCNVMKDEINILFRVLRVPFKSTVRHAAATRNAGESLWVQARRGRLSGFGEGCPRGYVTGETLDSSYQWLEQHVPEIQSSCQSLDQLLVWQSEHEELIDAAPSSWCAVECALLDLFARENACSVETLLGQKGPEGRYEYTAVLGDSEEWRFTFAADHYLTRGFTNYKVKLSGELQKDRYRLKRLAELCQEHGVSNTWVRLDANNLWAGHPEVAIEHLSNLDMPFFAIEEPMGPREVESLSQVSLALNCSIILDESLCKLRDLDRFDGAPGQFIANLKVSKVGGICRGLKLVEAVRGHEWPIIIGAHVGETSLLTRAGLLLAQAAGDSLLAQEGAFGSYLLEWDPAEPNLKFARGGILDLKRPYADLTVQGLRVVSEENWKNGWGLRCSYPPPQSNGRERVLSYRMPDGYDIHYRLWGPEGGDDVLVILHGGMSHSGWQYPLAQEVQAKSHMSVVAPDRRGCGLNARRGDLGSIQLVIQDVVEHLRDLKGSFRRIHLVGWCQGAQYASIAAAKVQSENVLSSLVLITPGFFWNDRFRSVIDMAEKMMFSLRSTFKFEPEREKAFVPIPMQASDFTFAREWLAFIEEDPLKTTKITMKSALIMDEIQEMSWSAILAVEVPMLVILATEDRIVDNHKVIEYLTPLIEGSPRNSLGTIEACHALQFEKTEELTQSILSFIMSIQQS